MNSENCTKTINLICPKFFGYDEQIKQSLTKQGYQVQLIDERSGAGFIGKIILRLNLPIIASIYRLKLKAAILKSLLSNARYTLIINPEVLGAREINAIESETTPVVYLWDSFENKKHFKTLSALETPIISFDHEDSTKNMWKYLPLFYDEAYRYNGEEKNYDFTFIGTMHSDREVVLTKIINQISKDANTLYYKYLPHKIIYYFRKIFLKKYGYLKRSEYKFEKLNTKEVAKILKASKVVIDITHPAQKGLTSRTMEALSAGCKLITTNMSVRDQNFYDPSRIYIVDRDNPKIDPNFINMETKIKLGLLDELLSVEQWTKEVLSYATAR